MIYLVDVDSAYAGTGESLEVRGKKIGVWLRTDLKWSLSGHLMPELVPGPSQPN
jgi:hypothetical protein